MPQNTPMKRQFTTIDGRTVMSNLPQHWGGNDWAITGVDSPLPVGNYIQTDSGVWIPQKGSDDGAADVRLTGSNIGQPIETLTYQREGPLIGGGVREVLADFKNVECELQSLSLGTNQSGIQLRIHFYKKDGSLDGSLKIANKKGTTLHHPSPVQIQNQSNGENDFWKNQVYDTENDAYVMVMKRPLKCLNGLRIEVYNWDVESKNVAINVAIAIWGGK